MAFSKKHLNLKELVFEIVKKIPSGKVVTYGDISRILRISPRTVGWMLHLNKSADVPCHRVVDRNGRLAPNFGLGGWIEQKRRLEAEDVRFVDEMHVDLDGCLWEVNPKSEIRNNIEILMIQTSSLFKILKIETF